MGKLCRASVLYGPKDLRLEERELESPDSTELQIAIRATGLCGSDLHYYQHYRNGDIQVTEPLSLGHESAGVVVVVGSHVGDFKVGDRVALEVGLPCGECERCREGRYNICQHLRFRSSAKASPHFQGTLQDRINHPASWCHKLPDHVSYDVGAILEPLGVAIQASRRAQIAQESSTLVLGAGAVGLLCAAMAKVVGSSHVVIADIQQERVKFATQNGFAHEGFTVPSKRGHNIDEKLQIAKETAASATEKIRNGTGSTGGFDVVLECTGVEACTQAAIYATRPAGKVVIVGMGNPVQTLPISAAAHREVDILGTFRYANTYPQAIELVSGHNPLLPDLGKLVTHRFLGLDDVERAFEMAARANDADGNLVLKVVVESNDA
ncbi:hypothetical protein HO173_011154 [Letharia columbiana]|uniref:Enoyl reductase (ER) domain-containing protein n=1 Tax=Letharia columbiana TaxID=112416 RepID=A0A8H6FLA1_9LECA|nr:uncharacterized protein HO173_011154 [Letharia columbiana]KAF6230617.1 hypothetical protein HO173_011154 [Letharia columbiana]